MYAIYKANGLRVAITDSTLPPLLIDEGTYFIVHDVSRIITVTRVDITPNGKQERVVAVKTPKYTKILEKIPESILRDIGVRGSGTRERVYT